MAIATLADYLSLRDAPHQRILGSKTIHTGGSTGLVYISYWTQAPGGGSTPSTSAALDNTTTGALFRFVNASSDALYCVSESLSTTVAESSSMEAGTFLLMDRLVHQGGLDATLTSAQTTNLPTAALPSRATGGQGVMAFLEVYALIGTTSTTVTVSYTNQAGTAGRTSIDIGFGANTPGRGAGTLFPISLMDGDTGVRSVESVTLAATTGTAGNFGVVLAKPIAMLKAPGPYENKRAMNFLHCGNVWSLPNNACPWLVHPAANVTYTSGSLQYQLNIARA